MNNITILELILVACIVIIQTKQALKTHKKIKTLNTLIPDIDVFKIKKYNISTEDLQTAKPKEILNNLSAYHIDINEENETLFSIIKNEISLVNPEDKYSTVFNTILHSINVYLLRNKGASTDFNLIKDITERYVDIEENDINDAVTVPLYLGLIGTMLGIIFGLINLFIVSNSENDFEVQGFLLGVSIAMFASLYGLIWTVSNSNFKFKVARRNVEKTKNNFYTFIQTELLPILNQSVSSSIHTLHTNLVKFNDGFTGNINNLTYILNKNYDAVIAQESILNHLEKIDINEYAKANVKVLSELRNGTKDLQKFNQYLNLLNSTVENTSELSEAFESILERTNNFENLAQKLDNRVEESNKLVQFLNNHYEVLSERGHLITDSVKKVDDVLIKSLVELQDHTTTKITAIKEITEKEEDLMTQTLAENKSHFSKLSLLADLNENFIELKNIIGSNSNNDKNILEAIHKQLTNIYNQSEESIFNKFKKWLSKKDEK